MNLLVVSDIHYSLPQYDWLVRESASRDLVIIAGDLMELASSVELDTQASVVSHYFRRIAATTPLVVCSGNHDLIEEYDGSRSPVWLEELAIPNLTVDHGSYETPELRILSFPWWETDVEKARIEAWLEKQSDPEDKRPVFWVHHAPPLGAKTSWNGKCDLGDKALKEWIWKYSPDVVFSGHVHNAPYYGPEGSWIDRVGKSVVINGGRQIGNQPATVELTLEDGHLVWCGMEGCEEKSLQTA